jgi:hypothetical protein
MSSFFMANGWCKHKAKDDWQILVCVLSDSAVAYYKANGRRI